MVFNGLLAAGGQQALWECRELRLIQGRERSIQQAVLPHSLPVLSLCPASAAQDRAEGSWNEPLEPGAALLFMSTLCMLSCWAGGRASVLSLEEGVGALANLCSLFLQELTR